MVGATWIRAVSFFGDAFIVTGFTSGFATFGAADVGIPGLCAIGGIPGLAAPGMPGADGGRGGGAGGGIRGRVAEGGGGGAE